MGVLNPLYSYVSFESFLNHQTTLPLPPNMWYRTVFNMHKSNRSCTVPKFFRPFDINFFKLMVRIISSFSFIFSPLFFSLYLPLPLFHLLSSPLRSPPFAPHLPHQQQANPRVFLEEIIQ